ncbi:DUF927 domain-containing protein [Neisseria dumasiana]|uniref:DUF927 domain-containing protein n=1 Tax=Neisseria dumasiana TaxID=1931275 RepID=UPI000A18CA74|nr:DUF927 domain-containing protein [Neisseria dumasiana]OSI14973.1 helicase [Neisseria dumasiana]
MKNETIHDNTADTSPETIQAAALAEFEQAELRPHFQCTKNGVFYIAVETDKHGEVHEKPPLKLADPIELIGRGTDETGSHYRIIRWRDAVTRKARIEALPMAEIGVNWQRLQSHGITVMASRRKRELLADYLQTDGSNERYTVTNRAGWCADNTAYILPNGEAITAKKQPAKVIYNGDKSQADSYTESGSLEGWQQGIARYMAGNSRLCLAIGTALAAPLASLLSIEAGGFHLFGDSRDGKSTAAKAALSVWGNPETLMLTWTGTGLGFTNTAAARNDGLLVLDEIGQANAKAVAQTAYSVINGVSKVQGAKDGGNRELSRWRIFMLSTGEKPLNRFLRTAGVEWNAGQAARLPDIPSDAGKGLGIFDTLHGHEKGAALSEAITAHAARCHGTAGRALIRLLLEDPEAINQARAIMADFMAMLPDTDGQSRTVALRFAITAAALELAAKHGITGLGAGVGMTGIKQCFDAWYSRTGTGKYEDSQIIKQAIDFMQLYAESPRFTGWNSEFTNHDHAGYRKRAEQPCNDEFWIIPAVFESEISKGFEPSKACNVLHAIQWLKRNETAGRWKFQRSGGGRFYVLVGIEPPNQEEAV